MTTTAGITEVTPHYHQLLVLIAVVDDQGVCLILHAIVELPGKGGGC